MKRGIQFSAALLLATAIVLFAHSSLILFVNARRSGIFTGAGVGVYWDRACTKKVSTIDWGTLEPGFMSNVTMYLRNEADTSITLSIYSTNWNPTNASQFVSLSWNYLGQQIRPGKVVQVTLTLSLTHSISGLTTFTFDVIIGSFVNTS